MLKTKAPSAQPWQSHLADEIGGPFVDPSARARFALVYANSYHIGMSNVGFHYVHENINRIPGAACERFFTDHTDARSVDHNTPLSRFPIVLFSTAFEMDYLNIVHFLRDNGIPLEARERQPHHPLIIGGGVSMSLNRLPVYDFFDAFLIGYGEALVEPFVRNALECGDDPRRVLQAIEPLAGVEITYGARERFKLDWPDTDLDAEKDEHGIPWHIPCPPKATADPGRGICSSTLITPHTEFSRRALIEVSRGCPYVCTFCYVGHNFPSYQPRPLDMLFERIDHWRKYTERIGLVASAVGSHPEIDRICEYCDSRDAEVSFSSLRVEDVTPRMVESLLRSGQKSVTIAPEAGSEKLRKLTAKRLPDEKIYAFVENVFTRGVKDLKMYFMVGLPRETPEDVEAIGAMTERMREIMLKTQRESGHLGSITLNVGVFVPKPGTPLLRLSQQSDQTVKKHIKLLQKVIRRIPNVKLQMGSLRYARAQAVLSRGDRRAKHFILEMADPSSSLSQVLQGKAGNGDPYSRFGLPPSKM